MNTDSRQRPKATGTLVGIRFQAALLEAVDKWRKNQHDLPTRPEAVRRLVKVGMSRSMMLPDGASTQSAEQTLDDKI